MILAQNQRIAAIAGVVAVFSVVLSPVMAGAVSAPLGTTITTTVNAVISLATSGNVAIGLTPSSGSVVTSSSDAVTVNTNNSSGYALSLADSDATTTLVSGGNSIPAHTGTFGTPTALATNTWGYRVVSAGGFGASVYSAENNNGTSTSTWAGVAPSGSAQTLKTTATTASNDLTTVWYGVKVDATKPTGAYVDTVTYTAVTNL